MSRFLPDGCRTGNCGSFALRKPTLAPTSDSKLRIFERPAADARLADRFRSRSPNIRCEALAAWFTAHKLKPGGCLFPSWRRHGEHLTKRDSSRIIDRWVVLIGLDLSAFGTHNLRYTKVVLVLQTHRPYPNLTSVKS